MSRMQGLRLFSILSSLVVGIWFPLRLIGCQPLFAFELFVDLLVSVVSLVNVYLHFKEKDLDYKSLGSWKSPGLILDILCVVPWLLVEWATQGSSSPYLLFLNVFCARHIFRIRRFLEDFDSLQPIYYRLIPLGFTMPILIHLLACAWIMLGSGTAGPDPDKVFEYVKALYWTFTTLTTVGYGDISAKTAPQMLFAAGAQVVGVAVFGYVLSNVASLLSRLDAAREHHMDNLDRVETYMRTHKIPDALRLKIRSYYHYLWKNRKGYKDDALLEDLPLKIQSEMYLFINQKIIQKVPFLSGISGEMLEDLMGKLETRIFLPNERIFRVDEVGDALYFIQNGVVEIQSRSHEVLATLSDGAFFGEMALLSDQPRSATAVAQSYCDIYLLHASDFKQVVAAYPEFKQHIQDVMNKRRAA